MHFIEPFTSAFDIGRPALRAISAFLLLFSCGLAQTTQIPSSWFSADPKTVMSDPLFATFSLSTRKEVLTQIDPKFAKMKPDKQDAFLWNAETTYLPKAPSPTETFRWMPNDPASTSEVSSASWIGPTVSKTISAGGLAVQASMQRYGFLVAPVRIQNDLKESVTVRPQTFVLDVAKPKHYTLFFEYPSRVSYQFVKAGLDFTLPYHPTERTTVRSGTGRTVATVDSPDAVAKQDIRDITTGVRNAVISVAGAVEPRSLKEGSLPSGSAMEGDVYFERSDNARELVLKMVVSNLGFEIPFSLGKR
jgi:hypothetical protein